MGFLTSLLLGPIAGLAGSLISNVVGGIAGYFKAREERKNLEMKQAHETRLLEMNIAARGQEMESEALIAQAKAVAESLKASYEHDASYGPVSREAAVYLRWVRPALTGILLVMAGIFFFTSGDRVIDAMNDMTIRESIVRSVLMMAELAVTWFFVDRSLSHRLPKG